MPNRKVSSPPFFNFARALAFGLGAAAFVTLPSPAAGAAPGPSFSCSQARTRAERLICASPRAAQLDVQLQREYEAIYAAAADPAGLQRAQKAWLGGRDKCADATCIETQYAQRIDALKAVPRAQWQVYRNERMGISFEYLGNRRVEGCDQRDGKGKSAAKGGAGLPANCVKIVGNRMGNSDYLMAFVLYQGPLEKVAQDEAGFDKQDGEWVTTYGPGRSKVERFAGRGWRGMQATISCGISDRETGFHAAGGDCYWGVMSDGTRTIVADTEGILGTDEDTMRSVRSLQFLPMK